MTRGCRLNLHLMAIGRDQKTNGDGNCSSHEGESADKSCQEGGAGEMGPQAEWRDSSR